MSQEFSQNPGYLILREGLNDKVQRWLKFSTYILGESKGINVVANRESVISKDDPEKALRQAYQMLQESNIWERRIKDNPHIVLTQREEQTIFERRGLLRRKIPTTIPAYVRIEYVQPGHPKELQDTNTTLLITQTGEVKFKQTIYFFKDNKKNLESFFNIRTLEDRDATVDDLLFFDNLLEDPNF